MKLCFFAFLAVLGSIALPVYPQVPAVLVTKNAAVSIQEYGTVSGSCNTQDCSVSKTYVNYYNSAASASMLSVSGSMSRLYDNASPHGNSYVNSSMDIYAKVPLNQDVYIKAATNVRANWANNQNNIGDQSSVGASLSNQGYGSPDSNGCGVGPASIGESGGPKVLKVYGTAVATSLVVGPNTYYLVGHMALVGGINLIAYTGPNPSFNFTGSIGSVEVYYKGKVIKYSGGGDQTGLVGQLLPKPLNVLVVNDDTGLPAKNEPVTFTVLDPVNGAVLGVAAGTTDLNGLATTYLTLGTSVGPYTVRATCPGCLAAANEIDFAETAVGPALNCISCEWHGTVAQRLPTPFRLKVVNAATGEPVSGAAVAYEIISFTGKDGETISGAHPHGSVVDAFNTGTTDIRGFSRAYLTLGSEEGTYIVRARCESCLSNKEQIARGIAHKYSVIADGEQVATADPYVNAADCDSGCCPLTPVLRITTITPPNDGVSFTSDPAENFIGLKGRIQPECLGENNITWQVGDAPADNINSGIPVQPTPGEVSSFRVSAPFVPSGRPLPLAYKVSAGFDYNGKILSASKIVKQDEIDKCRQEYIDFGLGLDDVARGRFMPGLDGEFVGRPMDCYAHIYPVRAEEVKTLREAYNIRVTSGYRSPRKNKSVKGASLSWHMFGRAIDVEVLPETASNYNKLWDSVNCPVILESGGHVLLRCDENGNLSGLSQYINNQSSLLDLNKNKIPDAFEALELSGWLHMGN